MSNEELTAFLKKNLIAVVCVLISIGVGLALYLRSDLLPEAEKKFGEDAEKAALLAANIQNMEQLKEQHGSIVASNQKMVDRMIRVGQLAENLQYFYRIESDTNAKLTDLRQNPWYPPGRGASKTVYKVVSFNVTAQGTYSQLMDMLRRVESGEHYCRVTSFGMRPTGDIRGSAITMNLSLELLASQ